jgi:hypothetical protein
VAYTAPLQEIRPNASRTESIRFSTQAGQQTQLVISAVLFASSLFFAALASKLRIARYQNAALVVAGLLFIGTLIYVLSLPLEI